MERRRLQFKDAGQHGEGATPTRSGFSGFEGIKKGSLKTAINNLRNGDPEAVIEWSKLVGSNTPGGTSTIPRGKNGAINPQLKVPGGSGGGDKMGSGGSSMPMAFGRGGALGAQDYRQMILRAMSGDGWGGYESLMPRGGGGGGYNPAAANAPLPEDLTERARLDTYAKQRAEEDFYSQIAHGRRMRPERMKDAAVDRQIQSQDFDFKMKMFQRLLGGLGGSLGNLGTSTETVNDEQVVNDAGLFRNVPTKRVTTRTNPDSILSLLQSFL